MARHFRRLTLWFLAGIATLAVLAVLLFAALWFFLDPDDYRAQIQARASSAIGRPVHLTGALRWQLGRQIFIVSEGGDIANASGFGPEPLARWSKLRFGVAARPLFNRQVVIDRIDIDGLQLQLQRDERGAANWQLQPSTQADADGAQPVTVRIADVALHDSAARYVDAATGGDWRVSALEASVKLPADLMAAARQFRELSLEGRLQGVPLESEGVPIALRANVVNVSSQEVGIGKFTGRWAEANLQGSVAARLAGPDITAKLAVQAPSLRKLLATVRVTPPPMRDATTLGALQMKFALHYTADAATLDDLELKLDDTVLTGSVSVPAMQPLAVRFNLQADVVDLDRYREPVEVQSKPLELPLAWLKQLDAKGTLVIRRATLAGAAARQVRIDVE